MTLCVFLKMTSCYCLYTLLFLFNQCFRDLCMLDDWSASLFFCCIFHSSCNYFLLWAFRLFSKCVPFLNNASVKNLCMFSGVGTEMSICIKIFNKYWENDASDWLIQFLCSMRYFVNLCLLPKIQFLCVSY